MVGLTLRKKSVTYQKRKREKMENENGFAVGDLVVWNWVFDWPDDSGTVVAVDGNRIQVRCHAYADEPLEWMDADEVMLASEWDSSEYA